MTGSVLALDVGNKRIGVAVATAVARIPSPLSTISNDEGVFKNIDDLAKEHAADVIVVGLPRGLSGQETQQTKVVRQFVDTLKKTVTIPIVLQDEALTSFQAEQELQAKRRDYRKEDIDMLAAALILEDYLHEPARQN